MRWPAGGEIVIAAMALTAFETVTACAANSATDLAAITPSAYTEVICPLVWASWLLFTLVGFVIDKPGGSRDIIFALIGTIIGFAAQILVNSFS